MPISMDSFSWQVVATFFAAGGAVVVGLRQVDIARGQKDIVKEQANTARRAIEIAAEQAITASNAMRIADSQALTARLAQRGALFDRRFKIYAIVQNYIRAGMRGNSIDLMEHNDQLRIAFTESKFLFPANVIAAMDLAVDATDEYAIAFEQNKQGDPNVSPEDIRLLRKKLREILQKLSDDMGDEMKLYINSLTTMT